MAEGDVDERVAGFREQMNSSRLGFYGEMPVPGWPERPPIRLSESLPPPDRPHGRPPRDQVTTRDASIYVALARPLRNFMGVPQSAGITYKEMSITDVGDGWYELRVAFKTDAQQGHSWTTTTTSSSD